MENPGIWPAVNRFVIDYRELANLEWFGQVRPSFCSQDRHGAGHGRYSQIRCHPQAASPRWHREVTIPPSYASKATRVAAPPRLPVWGFPRISPEFRTGFEIMGRIQDRTRVPNRCGIRGPAQPTGGCSQHRRLWASTSCGEPLPGRVRDVGKHPHKALTLAH